MKTATKNTVKTASKAIAKGTSKGKAIVKQTSKGKAAPVAAKAPERSYGLDKAEIAELKAEHKGEKVVNPFREGSSYFTAFQAISSFGFGKEITTKQLVERFTKLADAEYLKSFKAKKSETKWEDRVVVNAKVICRKKDYGKSLVQLGYDLSYATEAGEAVFTLKTM